MPETREDSPDDPRGAPSAVTRACLALAALVVLAACGRSETPPTAPAPEHSPPQVSWSVVDAALILRDAQDEIVLALACEERPARMTIEVPRFREIGSEERLSFGADNEPFVFVAQLGAPSGVRAEAPISEDLLGRLERAGTVTANYGAQYEGPHPAPPHDQAAAFANACRAVAD